MSDPSTNFSFDRSKYERPNDAWTCGRACDGKPCRLGPTPDGGCRAGYECNPALEKREGEQKGRWRCTRPTVYGGPCEDGPTPSGVCSCAIVPCAPEPSLRTRRGRLTRWVTLLSFGILMVALGNSWKWRFISPNTVSRAHHGDYFGRSAITNHLVNATNGGEVDCAACHAAASFPLGHWAGLAFLADRGPLSLQQFQFKAAGLVAMRPLDSRCGTCHQQHAFHQPNIGEANSCSSCHLEHHGDRMAKPDDSTCAKCHGDAATMAVFGPLGDKIPSHQFDTPALPGIRAFRVPRPNGGRTNRVTQFWVDHPDFGVLTSGLKDANALLFNHALHLGPTVLLNGKPLDCANCHVPDPSGRYMARISFTDHCQSCHSLQFDPANPDLRLPHGSVEAVRAELSGLELLYANKKRMQPGPNGRAASKEEVARFVEENLQRMNATYGNRSTLETLVFTSTDPRLINQGVHPDRRSQYAGCAFCHVGTHYEKGEVQLPVPVIPDRWMLNGRFNHAKHTGLANTNCEKCHSVRASHLTSDINLPSRETCAECHKPDGGAQFNCSECHSYHLRLSN